MNYSNSNVLLNEPYSNQIRNELINLAKQLGTNVEFNSDVWFCDKLKKSDGHSNKKYILRFDKINKKYKEIIKYYILKEIGNIQISTLHTKISYFNLFFKFLETECNCIDLRLVDEIIINKFKIYLQKQKHSKGWKQSVYSAIYKFFKVMHDWPELPKYTPISRNNPFTRTFKDKKIKGKYIPDFVSSQIDGLFLNTKLPIHYRLTYWLLRSIPSRISEIAGMKIGCLKEYQNNYIITIPTWKQNGGYINEEKRLIHIKYEGHGKYLIDLIKQQEHIAKSLQNNVDKKNLLFTVYKTRLNGKKFKETGEIEFIKENTVVIFNESNMAIMLRNICRRFKITDENGKLFTLSSHQLRHTGITDRLYHGFTLVEIRDMTSHKGNQMLWNAYHHIQPEESKKIQNKVIDKKYNDTDNMPVYFRGRILNIDKKTEKRLLRNPRAYEISDGKYSLGICSNILSCSSGLFECLSCEYFIPDYDSLEYYEEQVKIWKKKVHLFRNQRQALENAQYNLNCYKAIVEKIKNNIYK